MVISGDKLGTCPVIFMYFRYDHFMDIWLKKTVCGLFCKFQTPKWLLAQTIRANSLMF